MPGGTDRFTKLIQRPWVGGGDGAHSHSQLSRQQDKDSHAANSADAASSSSSSAPHAEASTEASTLNDMRALRKAGQPEQALDAWDTITSRGGGPLTLAAPMAAEAVRCAAECTPPRLDVLTDALNWVQRQPAKPSPEPYVAACEALCHLERFKAALTVIAHMHSHGVYAHRVYFPLLAYASARDEPWLAVKALRHHERAREAAMERNAEAAEAQQPADHPVPARSAQLFDRTLQAMLDCPSVRSMLDRPPVPWVQRSPKKRQKDGRAQPNRLLALIFEAQRLREEADKQGGNKELLEQADQLQEQIIEHHRIGKRFREKDEQNR